VILLSSLHQSVGIQNSPKKLPETVEFYNATKFGVDIIDQMARTYAVKAASRRWPVQVFYNILDLAGINAWILFKEVTGNNITRRNFLLQLATELSDPYVTEFCCELQQRVGCYRCRQQPNDEDDNDEDFVEPVMKRRKCQVSCCRGNKTKDVCVMCKKFVCGVCTARVLTYNICVKCDNEDDSDDENVTYFLE